MRWVNLALLLSAVALVAVQFHTAQAQESLTAQVNAVDTSAYPSVTATVTVLQGSQPVSGLSSEAFSAQVGDQSVPISSVASASDPGLGISVVLTFDVSGSMAGQPLASAKEAGKTLVAQLGPADQVAIVAFANTVSQPLAFTQDKAAANAAIDALTAGGNTALYQGVTVSAGTASSGTLPRKAVVLLSDGVDFGGVSQVDAPGSLTAAAGSGAPFFVVGLGSDIDEGYLQQLATVTRGRLLLAPSPDDLTALYGAIGAALRQQYVLTLDASEVPPGTNAPLRISVVADGATATAETPLSIPVVETVPPSEPPGTAEPSATTAAGGSEEGGSGSAIVIAGGVVALGLLLGLAGGGFIFWRRRQVASTGAEIDFRRVYEQPTAPLFPPVAATVAPESIAYLQLEGNGTMYPLGDSPVTIGFTPDCAVHLPEGSAVRSERVRVWRREGRFMLHNLTRTGFVQVAGRPATWSILEDGDEIQIGRVRLMFHDRPPESS